MTAKEWLIQHVKNGQTIGILRRKFHQIEKTGVPVTAFDKYWGTDTGDDPRNYRWGLQYPTWQKAFNRKAELGRLALKIPKNDPDYAQMEREYNQLYDQISWNRLKGYVNYTNGAYQWHRYNKTPGFLDELATQVEKTGTDLGQVVEDILEFLKTYAPLFLILGGVLAVSNLVGPVVKMKR